MENDNKIVLKERFNKSPYFDNFDPKNQDYYKILFRSDRELQTRELNQIQSLLQEQINRLGSHIFQNGSIVTGCENKFNPSEYSASLYEDYFATRFPDYLNYFKDQYVISTTNNKTKIGKISLVLHSSENSKNESIIIISSISGDMFESNDVISLYDQETSETFNNYSLKISSIQNASTFMVNEGIIFVNGYFLYISKQKIIIDAYSNSPTVSIGFRIDDSIITYKDDFSILDNSYISDIDYNNTVAIGADRYKINSVLEFRNIITDENYAEQTQLDNFFEFVRIDSGKIIKNVTTTIYSELEKEFARRTYDESGNYTVKPFSLKVLEISEDSNQFNLQVSSGKAYVLGYEFESIAPRILKLDKSFDYATKESFDISTYYGSYIKVNNITGFFDVSSCEEIEFHSVPIINIEQGTKIGSGRIRHFKKVGSSYWIYLFNVSLDSGSFEQVISIKGNDNNATADLTDSLIHDTTHDSFLFSFPEKEIKEVYSTSYTIQESFKNIRFSPSIEPSAPQDVVYGIIHVQSNEQLYNLTNYYTVVNQSNGQYLEIDSIEYIDENSTAVIIKIINQTEFTANILTLVDLKDDSFIKKGDEKEETFNISVDLVYNQEFFVSPKLTLGVSLKSIIDDNDNNLTNLFELKVNETKNLIKPISLIYRGQSELSSNLFITFKYIDFTNVGYFSIESFKDMTVELPDIIVEDSNKNIKRNSIIDFRPITDEFGNIVSSAIPIPDGTFECDYSYYLSRFDKLIVTSNKNFGIIKGTPAYKPNVPNDDPNAMTLYTIFIPAGNNNPSLVSIKFHENKRYTMRDIGKLESRIENLEYYTSLSLLEKDTESFEILDESGNNRFKNGFLVDNFKNFKSLDFNNPDNKCSFDLKNGYLRPSFEMKNIGGLFNKGLSTAVQAGELIMLPYKEIPFIQQLQCSETMNLQPYEVFTWDGSLKLTPEIDEWVDTETKPDVTINQFGENDIWESIGASAFNAEWGSWETKITKVGSETSLSDIDKGDFTNINGDEELKLWNPSVDSSVGNDLINAYNEWVSSGFKTWFTQATPDGYIDGSPAILIPFKSSQISESRSGSQLAFDASSTITNSLGEKVTDVSIIPFMRAVDIKFEAKNLKPTTQVYAFFDNKSITEFCIQDGRTQSGYLETDEYGKISGIFSLPKGIFPTGSRLFRICDNSTNNQTFITTVCESKFTANGLSQTKQETYLSTREPQLTTIDLSETKIVEDAVYAWGNFPIQPSPTPTPTLTPTPTPSYPNKTQVQICLDAPLLGTGVNLDKDSDFLFLLDRSGSMQKSAQYLDDIKEQLITLLSNSNKNRFGLSYFRNDETGFPENWCPVQDFSTELTISFSKNDPFGKNKFVGFSKSSSALISFNNILNNYKENWVDLSGYSTMAISIRDIKTNNSFDFRSDRNKFIIIITDELDEKLFNVPSNPIRKLSNSDSIITKISKNISDTQIFPLFLIPNKTEYITQTEIISQYQYLIDTKFNKLGGVIPIDINGKVSVEELVDNINSAIEKTKNITPNKITVSTIIDGIDYKLDGFLLRNELTLETPIISTNQSSIQLKIEYDPDVKILSDLKRKYDGTLLNNNLSTNMDISFIDLLQCKLTKIYNQDTVPHFPSLDDSDRFDKWFSNVTSDLLYEFKESNKSKTVEAFWHYPQDPKKEIGLVMNEVFGTTNKPQDFPSIWNSPALLDLVPTVLQEMAKRQTFQEITLTIPIEKGKFNYIVIKGTVFNTQGKVSITDPLAQSFTIDEDLYPEGVFVSSLDIFLKTKSSYKPIRIELRNMVNGIPNSKEYIPFSRKFIYPDEIEISNDALTPTHITFDSPIYLLPGDYAFCTIADTTDYNAYIARLGEFQLGSTTERIEKNPYSGVLFKSANSVTWLPQPDSDFKFILYRCSFVTDVELPVVINNTNNDGNQFNFNSICMNASTIIPDKTTMSNPRNQFLDQTLNVYNQEYEVNLNSTTELNNTFVIREEF